MRLLKIIPLAALLALLLGFQLISAQSKDAEPKGKSMTTDTTSAKEIHWYDLQEGLKLAQERNKHVFIDFSTSWCGWCRKMERDVFSDPEVEKVLNQDFVPVKVDGDSEKELMIKGYKVTEKNLTKYEFKVRGYPTFWFLTPDGNKLGAIVGYKPKDYMLQQLAMVKDYKYDTTRTTQPAPTDSTRGGSK
jgi:thioredoxin-related protein